MFNPNKTVFILGAGASWHYGYPTGEELVEKVKAKARTAANHFNTVLTSPANGIAIRPGYIKRSSENDPPKDGTQGMRKEWENTLNECTDLLDRLTTVDPLVIDYFLGQNPHLSDIGKFLIAWVILECEALYIRDGINNNRRDLLLRTADVRDRDRATSISYIQQNYKDNWYRFVLHKLVTGCPDAESLLDNKVTFITFNYDVSLEYQLFRGLSSLAQFSENDAVHRFFDESRFIHIYRKVRDDAIAKPPPFNLDLLGGPSRNPKPQPGSSDLWTATTALFNTIYDASRGIRTIAPNEKTVDANVECARQAIEVSGDMKN